MGNTRHSGQTRRAAHTVPPRPDPVSARDEAANARHGAADPVRQLLRTPLDHALTDATRLRLMAALIGLPPGGWMSFTMLRQLLDLTDGNLGMHLRMLVERGYASITKTPLGRRSQSRYAPTPQGRAAFAAHVEALEAIIAAASGSGPGLARDGA